VSPVGSFPSRSGVYPRPAKVESRPVTKYASP
jgi:hypothetical protein